MGLDKKALGLMAKLAALEGAVNDYHDPHANVIRISRSPSVGFTFGNGHGLPAGYTLMLYGPNKGGKSLICNDTIGALHEDDPEAVAVKFDAEFREELQMTPQRMKMFGIDRSRYKCWSVNQPELIFDRFENDVAAACESGLKVRLAILDSTSAIQGRREAGAESVNQFQIGDHAQTLQIGLKRILPVIRKYKIALILVTHVRAEMDQAQVKQGNTVKAQASWAVKHYAEYFGYVERNDWKEGRFDAMGKEMVDETVEDMRGKGEQVGHKIRFFMKESSAGPRGRMGEFMYDYRSGIDRLNEEVFLLAKARNVITNKGANYYFGERRWNGKEAAMVDLGKDPDLQKEILRELRKRDLAGEWAADEKAADAAPDAQAILDNAAPAE